MAAFLYRLAGSPNYVPLAQSPLTDIAAGNPLYREISRGWKAGIVTGWSESNGTQTLEPSTSVLRDLMAAFMYRYATR